MIAELAIALVILAVVAMIGTMLVTQGWLAWKRFDPFAEPPPPSPLGPRSKPVPIESLGSLFSYEDYPAEALRYGIEGRARARMEIDAQGRVTDCRIVTSSGSAILDRGTCDIVDRRAKFVPAGDAAGNPVASTYPLSITWQIAQ